MAFVAHSDAVGDPRTALIVVTDKWNFPVEKQMRGERVPVQQVPKTVLLLNNIKELPDLVSCTKNYWLASEVGRKFLEENAPDQCEFVSTEVWRNKKSATKRAAHAPEAPIEKAYFWVNLLRRVDAIDWARSTAQFSEIDGLDRDTGERRRVGRVNWPKYENPGAGLLVCRTSIGDSQIWRDNFSGLARQGLIFLSDSLKEKIRKGKLGRFEYIPVLEM